MEREWKKIEVTVGEYDVLTVTVTPVEGEQSYADQLGSDEALFAVATVITGATRPPWFGTSEQHATREAERKRALAAVRVMDMGDVPCF